jgi:hypothetical protein
LKWREALCGKGLRYFLVRLIGTDGTDAEQMNFVICSSYKALFYKGFEHFGTDGADILLLDINKEKKHQIFSMFFDPYIKKYI